MGSADDAQRKRDDTFESRYMPAEGTVLHRDKRVSRVLAGIMGLSGLAVIGVAIFIALVNGTSQKPVPAEALPLVVGMVASLGVLIATIGIAMGILRTVVTDREVNVKYGLWGPTIAMKDILSCRPVTYRWIEFGGWGIRLGRDGTWAYVPIGDQAIEIVYNVDGKTKRVLVGVENPEQTAAVITRASARFSAKHDTAGDAVPATTHLATAGTDDVLAEEAAAEEEATAEREAHVEEEARPSASKARRNS